MSNLKSQAFLEPHRTNSKFVWVSVAALTSVMIQHFFVYPVIKERFIYSLWRILLWTKDQGIFNGCITLMKCFGHVCFLQIFESFDGWYTYIMRNQSQLRCFEGGVFLLGNFSYNRWYPLHRFASKTVWILKVQYYTQLNKIVIKLENTCQKLSKTLSSETGSASSLKGRRVLKPFLDTLKSKSRCVTFLKRCITLLTLTPITPWLGNATSTIITGA